MDNDKRHNHGLIVRDGDPQTVIHPDIDHELDEVVPFEAVVVVYDITNRSSFDEAKHRVEEHWRAHKDLFGPCLVGLVGSKADLWMHRKIKYEVLSCYNYIHVKLPWN